MRKKLVGYTAILLMLTACSSLQDIGNQVVKTASDYASTGALSNSEVVAGLKEALKVGTTKWSSNLSKAGAFFKNPSLKILFPPEVKNVSDKLKSLGMTKLVNDFEKSMNTAAERAMVKAKPIFVNAITSMNISDAMNILKGSDNAATNYFKQKTRQKLLSAFKPEINKSLKAVNATKYWSDITSTYNKLPFVTKVNTDLAGYVTNRAIDGLFKKIADEEKNIRNNPSARVSSILKKVFANA